MRLLAAARLEASGRARKAATACIRRSKSLGRVGRDQVEDYARRLGEEPADVERRLAPHLGYDPAAPARLLPHWQPTVRILIAAEAPEKIIVAIPVAPPEAVQRIRAMEEVEEVVCLETPRNFHAVGQFYEDFAAVSDEEALAIFEREPLREDPKG